MKAYLPVEVSSRFSHVLKELTDLPHRGRGETIQYVNASGACYACSGEIRGNVIRKTIERQGAVERYLLHNTCPG